MKPIDSILARFTVPAKSSDLVGIATGGAGFLFSQVGTMKRQTVNVEKMAARVNQMLAESTCAPDVRAGMASILEIILMDANRYGGFRNIDKNDDSRRFYFVK